MNNTIRISTVTAALALALVSCKKDKSEEFTATDVTGTSVVSGHVSKPLVTSDGAGGWTSGSARTNAQAVKISITVNRSALYPNSNAQGADVYSATTDANGNYSIPVKSNATGVPALITIEGFNGTIDTMQVNGQVKTGPAAIFTGTTQTRTLVMGQNVRVDHDFSHQLVNGNPNNLQTGNATVTGSVSMSLVRETTTGTVINHSSVNVPVSAGHKVYLSLSNDPGTMATRVYETTTDANGYYTFNVTTVGPGNTGFPQSAIVWVNDYAATRDTLRGTNTRVPGLPGVYPGAQVPVTGVFTSSIKNAIYVRYITFVPN
jgi:hypothetical protein